MKILHTADWHIGKQLKKQSLNPELKHFFLWLAEELSNENYDVLIVSGDIFDSFNPKADDRALYYETVTTLSKTVNKVIITGGNHDSIAVLNAAIPVLNSLNISVIGGATEEIKDELFHIETTNDEACVIAAIPYLRDKDVLTNQTFDNDQDRPSQIRAGYEQHYRAVYDLAKELYPTLPLIGMGHLYATGAKLSDSERDIQVGNQGAVKATIFEGYDYVALGHIHRPQRVNKLDTVRYSGSPVALSFSEKKDIKQVVKVTLTQGKIDSITPVEVPKFRDLLVIQGTYAEVQKQLSAYTNTYPLKTYIDVRIKEEERDLSLIPQIEETINHYNKRNEEAIIIKHSIDLGNSSDEHASLFVQGKQIDDLSHREVFDKLLDIGAQNQESKVSLIKTYTELSENYQDYLNETA